ncbi:MAG: class I SAM-dependent methyltransferase [Betaproteobacteria bacterium]|nr:MAG: class I SAM-dependent methyltransferase [Betaproteobacteria bacterium]
MRDSTLPTPDAAAQDASGALTERIAAEIRDRHGWIAFARFMEMALYEPQCGYYAAGAAQLGRGGDFVTAPELSPLFGRSLARAIAGLLRPGDAILEFGGGSGALAAQLCDELETLGAGAPPYCILETSRGLAARQRARLGDRVRWLERLPERFCGVMLANEVVDAMPVHALAWSAQGIAERGVCFNEGQLAWCERPAAGEVAARAGGIGIELPPSGRYESELSLAGPAWVRTLAASLERGAIFVIDYGFPQREYYHPQRSMGTLMCHYRHRAHGDPFFYPGLQDITAHVDFSALARAAEESGLELLGYTGLAQFLVNCGITDLLGAEDATDIARYAPLAASAQLLLSPAEMGELFKVLALGRGIGEPLPGFRQGDRSHAL